LSLLTPENFGFLVGKTRMAFGLKSLFAVTAGNTGGEIS
jgi:hypothetical protein